MADLQRPIKTEGTRQYQTEFALGQEFAKDVEMDNDLDTIYNAWNTMIPPAVQSSGMPPGVLQAGICWDSTRIPRSIPPNAHRP
jgi:hypothetical protein